MDEYRSPSPLQTRTILSSVNAGMSQEPSPDFWELVKQGLVEIVDKNSVTVKAKLTAAGKDYLHRA